MLVALSIRQEQPGPLEWLDLDVGWFETIVACRNAYETGRREVIDERAMHERTAESTRAFERALSGKGGDW